MSFRDLRLLTENLRVLGYPTTVSLDSFREPNFKLVAELLIWLCGIYEPRVVIPHSIESEHDRINLIKTVSSIFITKQHIKLNNKKLYQADGYAVKELLKLINSLVSSSGPNSENSENENSKTLEGNIKSTELKELRERVSKITRAGVSLHEALGASIRNRSARHAAAINQLELSEIEKTLKEAIQVADRVTVESRRKLESADSDEKGIENKIEKKQNELERNQKRLRQLKQLRPAYQDELEELESELKTLYDDYSIKFRNSIYLESLLEEYRKENPKPKNQFNTISSISNGIGTTGIINQLETGSELTSDDDDSLIDENRQLFRQDRHNQISEDGLTDDESEDDDDELPTNDDDDF
jgi:clusterin-associated protein 1